MHLTYFGHLATKTRLFGLLLFIHIQFSFAFSVMDNLHLAYLTTAVEYSEYTFQHDISLDNINAITLAHH